MNVFISRSLSELIPHSQFLSGAEVTSHWVREKRPCSTEELLLISTRGQHQSRLNMTPSLLSGISATYPGMSIFISAEDEEETLVLEDFGNQQQIRTPVPSEKKVLVPNVLMLSGVAGRSAGFETTGDHLVLLLPDWLKQLYPSICCFGSILELHYWLTADTHSGDCSDDTDCQNCACA